MWEVAHVVGGGWNPPVWLLPGRGISCQGPPQGACLALTGGPRSGIPAARAFLRAPAARECAGRAATAGGGKALARGVEIAAPRRGKGRG